MKRTLSIVFILLSCASLASYAANDPIDAKIDIAGKYGIPVIYARKSYSVSLRADSFSPSDNGLSLNNSPGTGSNMEICFKTSDTIDQMIRFGTQSRRLVTSSPIDATYDVLKVGWGARVYIMEWGEVGGSYGLFNMYAILGLDTYSATRKTLVSGTPPDSFTGGGFTFGGGVELVFSPITSFMLEAAFQRTWLIKDALELPLDGFVVSAGVKIDLI